MCRILKLDADEAKAVPTDRGAHKTPVRVSALALSSYSGITACPERSRRGARRSLHRAVNGVQRTARPTSIKQRRQPVTRTINPYPILRSLAQSFANRIHQDVAGFLFQFVMVAQAVVEEITLPTRAMFSANEFLPVLDDRCHSRFARERNNRMQVIRH